MGDVDGENGVTKADALLVVRYVVGLETLTDEQKTRADVNGDGKVNALDAAAILRLVNPKA
ncbi:MAG: dockerin type I repeat-containing protein [Clostridia bacterium]|nr:dockerin type I repeat-containing protein [Clostridia bacterium]